MGYDIAVRFPEGTICGLKVNGVATFLVGERFVIEGDEEESYEIVDCQHGLRRIDGGLELVTVHIVLGFCEEQEDKMTSSFQAGTGLKGATESGQIVTVDNIHELPPGSVVRIVADDEIQRLIHLHDRLWLWCCDGVWCYDRIERLKARLTEKSFLCHIPVEMEDA